MAVLDVPRQAPTEKALASIPPNFQEVIRHALKQAPSARTDYSGAVSYQAEYYLAASVRWCQLRLELLLTKDRSDVNLARIKKLISVFEGAYKKTEVSIADPTAATDGIENSSLKFYGQNASILNQAAKAVTETKARKSGNTKYFNARDALAGIEPNDSRTNLGKALMHFSDSLASRLAAHNQGLVVGEATKDRKNLADRITIGNIGLLDGIVRFQPEQGFRLSTFVMNWIRRSLSDARHSEKGGIYAPRWIITEKNAALRIAASLELNKIDPENTELVRRFQEDRKIGSEAEARSCLEFAAKATVTQTGGLPSDLKDKLLTPASENPLEVTAQHELVERIRSALEQLKPIHALVIKARFNLDGESPTTFKELGERLGVSRARAQQLQAAAINALQGLIYDRL